MKLIKNLPESDEKAKALEYHKNIAKNRKAFLQDVGSRLDDQINEESIKDTLG